MFDYYKENVVELQNIQILLIAKANTYIFFLNSISYTTDTYATGYGIILQLCFELNISLLLIAHKIFKCYSCVLQGNQVLILSMTYLLMR